MLTVKPCNDCTGTESRLALNIPIGFSVVTNSGEKPRICFPIDGEFELAAVEL